MLVMEIVFDKLFHLNIGHTYCEDISSDCVHIHTLIF